MKIDYKTIVVSEASGYGNASRELTSALKGQGVEISPGSDVMLNFCMPPDYEYRDWTVGYTPWESTQVPKNWIAGLKAVDDLWVTSEFVADVFSDHRRGDIFVLPHGISDFWEPVRHTRNPNRPFTFLHVGEPAERKGGDLVLEAWQKAFAGNKNFKLIYKCMKYTRARVKDSSGSIVASPVIVDNVECITNRMTQQELYDLYASVDCLVYPTRGEGFGLIPFEAIASGLPTIVPYLGVAESFVNLSSIALKESKFVQSDNQTVHPGLWLDHSVDEIIDAMQMMYGSYEMFATMSISQSEALHKQFSWSRIAKSAKQRLLER